jgi:ABC-2 type transport system ATP-binding protein
MSETAPVIELTDISKTYGRSEGGVRAVRDVSLSVRGGEVYGFLGPNGAGKSTTIRMLLGLISPTGGEVRLFGQKLATEPAVLKRVGSLVDGGNFYPFLSGRRNLEVLARTHGMERAAEKGRIDTLLDQVGLGGDGGRKVKGYSTGMRQRLGVAAALLNDPDVVILDEPANGLDAAGIQEMRFLIRRLAEEDGKAVFLSSHLLHEVQQLCDRVAIITKGAVVHESTIADLLRHDSGFPGGGPADRGRAVRALRTLGMPGGRRAAARRCYAGRGAGAGQAAGRRRRGDLHDRARPSATWRRCSSP